MTFCFECRKKSGIVTLCPSVKCQDCLKELTQEEINIFGVKLK